MRLARGVIFSALSILVMLSLFACQSFRHEPSPKEKKHQMAAADNVHLGMGYLQQGDITRAKRKFNLALKQAPHWPPALNGMAYFMSQTQDYAAAERLYHQSLSYDAKLGDTHNNYGTFLYQQNKYEQAISEFLTATRDPDFMLTGAAFENAGLSALKIPDNKRAKEYFEKAIVQDKTRATSFFELAKLSYAQGDIAVASRYLDQYENVAGVTPESLKLACLLAHAHVPAKNNNTASQNIATERNNS